MTPIWFLRMARWARNPPPAGRVKLVLVVVALWYFFNRTLQGKAMLATSFNRLAAELVGINTASFNPRKGWILNNANRTELHKAAPNAPASCAMSRSLSGRLMVSCVR